MPNSIQKSINRGALIQAAGNAFRLLEFLLTFAVARLFGATTFGEYVFITAMAIPFVRLSTMGLDKSLIWFIAKHNSIPLPASLFRFIKYQSSVLTLIILTGYGIYVNYFGTFAKQGGEAHDDITAVILVMCSVPFLVFTNINLGLSIGKKRLEHEVIIRTIIYPIFYLGFPCILFLIWPSLTNLAFFFLLGSFAGYVFSRISAVRILKSIPKAEPSEPLKPWLRILYGYSWPLWVREVLMSLVQRVDILSIGFFLDKKSLGIYGVALGLSKSLKTVRMSFDNIMFPVIAELKRRRDDSKIKYAYLYAAQIITAIQFPIIAFLVFFAGEFLSLAGPEYIKGKNSLIIFSIAFLFNGYLGLSAMIVMGLGKSRWGLFNDIFSLALAVGLNAAFIPLWGLTGAALASSLTIILTNFIWYFESAYLIKAFPISWRFVQQYLWSIAAVVPAVIVYNYAGFQTLSAKALCFLIFVILYFIVIYVRFRDIWFEVLNKLFVFIKSRKKHHA